MNMRRIVFMGAAILICVVIIGITLHTMTHINEVNQERREKEQGEAIASRMATTTATTSVWDRIRPTETEALPEENTADSENIQDSESPTEALPSEDTSPFPETEGISSQTETALVITIQ